MMRDYTSPEGRPGWKIVLVAVAALALLAGGVLLGRSVPSDSDGGVAATGLMHGPLNLREGIPVGYTRDAAGAASAAAGWQYAVNAATNARLDPARLIPELAARNPSDAVREAVSAINPNTAATAGVVVPVRVTVLSFAADRAMVRVVSCQTSATSTSGLGDRCGTTDLALAWESDDWKIADRRWSPQVAAVAEAGDPLLAPLMVFVQ